MAIFEKFPYSDLHNLNLDWMINQFKEWEAKYAEYDAELNELKTAVEGAQAALDQDEQNLAAAITRLDNAIQALPATIREVVRQEIYPAVEEQLPGIVDEKLPAQVQRQLPDEFKDWMDEHFTEPPIDPTMTMAYGVPSARAAGNIFDYLQGLKIEGYTNLQDYVEIIEDGTGNWDGTGGYEGASNSMRRHFNVVGGLTYRLSGWHPAGLAPTIEDIVFGQGPLTSSTPYFTPIGSIRHEDIPNYRVSGSTYDIPIPKGADLLLVNSQPRDGHPYGPEVKGPTFEFKGGSELRGLSPVTGSTSLKFTDGEDISNALRYGRPVTFRFMASSQFGELYASVAAAKLVREYDLWDIVMLTDNDQLIKARCDTSAVSNGYLRDITVVDLGGNPGPAPVVNFSIVVNLTAGQNNTFTGNISLEDLQSALDDAESIWLSYPGATANDYDLRQVVEYNQDLTDNTSLRIGVFSEDEYIVYSVVDNGNNGVTLTVVRYDIINDSAIRVGVATYGDIIPVSVAEWNRLWDKIENRQPLNIQIARDNNFGLYAGERYYYTIPVQYAAVLPDNTSYYRLFYELNGVIVETLSATRSSTPRQFSMYRVLSAPTYMVGGGMTSATGGSLSTGADLRYMVRASALGGINRIQLGAISGQFELTQYTGSLSEGVTSVSGYVLTEVNGALTKVNLKFTDGNPITFSVTGQTVYTGQ